LDLLTTILIMMGRVILDTITSPLFILILLLLFVIISWQYKRLEKISEKLLNSNNRLYLRAALLSSAAGILGGLLGSILLILVGIDLDKIGIMYLWILALLLMLFNPRFLCFAYAAGILSLSNLFFSYPDISIPHLLGLVAILHMIESFLILINGHTYPIPLYVKKKNVIRGGFNLQKFWPLPLIAMVSISSIDPLNALMPPDWWPLFKDYTGTGVSSGQVFTLLPVIAVLGYGEITTTSTPKNRVKKSSFHLFIYSLLLFLLAGLSCRWGCFALIAALFSPLGHEFVIWLGMREENNREPLYVKPLQGVKVLSVEPGSTAQKAGILPGDIIINVNDVYIKTSEEINELFNTNRALKVRVKRGRKEIKIGLSGSCIKEAGIIPVPDYQVSRYLLVDEDRFFNAARKIWQAIKRYY